MKIDFVVTWVDGNDLDWIKQKQKYDCDGDVRIGRYRDWELLRYWFRAIERYASWVNRVYFVTYGHIPDWLNLNHNKLKVVTHREFIPEKYLPTFSSHPIELNLHRIADLEDNFVYFNDDVFLNNYVSKEDFFINEKPCDFLNFGILTWEKFGDVFPHVLINNNSIINQYFDIRNIKKSSLFSTKYKLKNNLINLFMLFRKDISILRNIHLSQSYKKTTFIELWDKLYPILDNTCNNKFRCSKDVSPYLFRDWQILEGNFEKIDISHRGKSYQIGEEDISNIQIALKGNDKMICVNDSYCNNEDFELLKNKLIQWFEEKFPDKSKFENE